MDKYELTDEKMELKGCTLYRIRALKDFSDVEAGDIGGWVEDEDNLSQEGDCWIGGEARVFGYAQVSGDAHVYGNAEVFDSAHIFGNAEVFDDAMVYDIAKVYGDAEVYGQATVYENAKVFEDAFVYGNAEVFGNARVYGKANVYEYAQVFENALVYDKAKVFGDAWVRGNAKVDYDVSEGEIESRRRQGRTLKEDIKSVYEFDSRRYEPEVWNFYKKFIPDALEEYEEVKNRYVGKPVDFVKNDDKTKSFDVVYDYSYPHTEDPIIDVHTKNAKMTLHLLQLDDENIVEKIDPFIEVWGPEGFRGYITINAELYLKNK